jgi:hypothetical protein
MAILVLEAASCGRKQTILAPVVTIPGAARVPPSTRRVEAARRHALSCTLNLSRSRTHDAVLDILRAHKLSGNFHLNLEAVLKDMGFLDKVTYHIERNLALVWSPDCCRVVFSGNKNLPNAMFEDIMRSIAARLGFDRPWWGKLFHRPHLRMG